MALILVTILASLAVEASARPSYAYDGYGGRRQAYGQAYGQGWGRPYAYDGYGGLKSQVSAVDTASYSETTGDESSFG